MSSWKKKEKAVQYSVPVICDISLRGAYWLMLWNLEIVEKTTKMQAQTTAKKGSRESKQPQK